MNDRCRPAQISRRDALLLFGAAGSSGLLAACGGLTEKQQPAKRPGRVRHPKVAIDRIVISNWPLYVDRAVLRDFERRFDAELTYHEDINDNAEFDGKVRAPLERGTGIDRDIAVLTDWMAARWIRQGFLEPLDKRNIPNASRLIEPLRSPPFDSSRRFTLPWQSGMTVIVYNREHTGGELRSLNELFNPKYRGRVSMLSEARDSISFVLMGMGVAPERASMDEIHAAIEKVDEAVQAGQVRRFTGIDYTGDLANGNLSVCIGYAQDVLQLRKDNPGLDYVVPDEGALLWTDNALIPSGAEHPYAAETFLNYVYEPEVAARITSAVKYMSPVRGVREVLERTDPDTAHNSIVFPDDETLARLHLYYTLSEAEEREVAEEFARVTGA